jgi:hypothetical protein
MGNHLPEINHISHEYTEVQKWLAGFLEAVDTLLHTLFSQQAVLILEEYPDRVASN